jgi:hypothetical protein
MLGGLVMRAAWRPLARGTRQLASKPGPWDKTCPKQLTNLLDNNKAWVKEMLESNPEAFDESGKGQSPNYLWIGCADSRVPAETLLGLDMGKVVRACSAPSTSSLIS